MTKNETINFTDQRENLSEDLNNFLDYMKIKIVSSFVRLIRK